MLSFINSEIQGIVLMLLQIVGFAFVVGGFFLGINTKITKVQTDIEWIKKIINDKKNDN